MCVLGGGWLWPWVAHHPSRNHSLISWPIKSSKTGTLLGTVRFTGKPATDRLKSSGEITTLFTSRPPLRRVLKAPLVPPLCVGPVKARAERVSEYIVCVNRVLTDTLKLCVPPGNYTLGIKCPLYTRSPHINASGKVLPGLSGTDFPHHPEDERWSSGRRPPLLSALG